MQNPITEAIHDMNARRTSLGISAAAITALALSGCAPSAESTADVGPNTGEPAVESHVFDFLEVPFTSEGGHLEAIVPDVLTDQALTEDYDYLHVTGAEFEVIDLEGSDLCGIEANVTYRDEDTFERLLGGEDSLGQVLGGIKSEMGLSEEDPLSLEDVDEYIESGGERAAQVKEIRDDWYTTPAWSSSFGSLLPLKDLDLDDPKVGGYHSDGHETITYVLECGEPTGDDLPEFVFAAERHRMGISLATMYLSVTDDGEIFIPAIDTDGYDISGASE